MGTIKKKDALETMATVAYVLNFVVTAIIAVETVVRFTSFIREWNPLLKPKKHMGFRREK